MEYQRIKYFLKAAKTQNFSQAAKELYISPQALTKQIALLEEELGVKLFERSTRNVHLNEAGIFAENKLRLADQMLEDAIRQIREFAAKASGKVRVGFFSALPKEELITPVLSLILANFPGSHMELKMLELTQIRQEMAEGGLDFAFTNAHCEEDWGDCRKMVFQNLPVQVVVSMYHPWALKKSITREDMEQEVFLKLEQHIPYKKEVGKNGFYEHIPCREVMKIPNFDTLITLLSQGRGFAVFPKAFHDSKEVKFQYFDVPGRSLWFQTVCFFHAGESNPKILQILQLIREEFGLSEKNFPDEQINRTPESEH
mgnify:CR=1 FL=1